MERRRRLREVEGEGLGAKVEADRGEGVDTRHRVEGELQRLGGERGSEVGAVEREEDAARADLLRVRVRVRARARVRPYPIP